MAMLHKDLIEEHLNMMNRLHMGSVNKISLFHSKLYKRLESLFPLL